MPAGPRLVSIPPTIETLSTLGQPEPNLFVRSRDAHCVANAESRDGEVEHVSKKERIGGFPKNRV
jgi:hypothetical protein